MCAHPSCKPTRAAASYVWKSMPVGSLRLQKSSASAISTAARASGTQRRRAVATFRVFGNYQMTAVHAVSLLAVAATCFLIFLAGRRLASTRAGVLAAVFYGVMTGAGNPRLLAANTEVFMMLPLTASLLLMLRRQWLWSG